MEKEILVGDEFIEGTTCAEIGDGWIKLHVERKRRCIKNPIRKILRGKISDLLFELYRMWPLWENTESMVYLVKEYRRLRRIYKTKKGGK